MTTSILRDKDQLINQVVGLDFEDVRANLVNFLKAQDRFTDYDFEGSNLSVLIDLLSYHSASNKFYINALVSESFLPTAVNREAVVARAKQVGYRPRSTRSAIAFLKLDLEYTASGAPPSFVLIPVGTKFNTSISGQRAVFQTTREYTAPALSLGSKFYEVEVAITEGFQLTQETLLNADNIDIPIQITNVNVDTTTLRVEVLQSASSVDGLTYALSDNITKLSSTSNVYFLEEIENLRYQINFGDGVLGRSVSAGNRVRISYLVSRADEVNGASVFSLSTAIPLFKVSLEVLSNAAGGAPIEDIPSIKVNAPLLHQTQQRSVTAQDYASIVKNNFPYVRSISVWGGEDNIPVALGYVFMAILPTFGAIRLSEQQKAEIENFLYRDFSVLAINPIVVDPDFLHINVRTTIKYDPLTAVNIGQLETNARNAILAFNTTFFNFGEYFRFSKLVKVIDSADAAIRNSLSEVQIERRIQFNNQSTQDYSIEFFNQIKPRSLTSLQFSYTAGITSYNNAQLFDNGVGVVGVGILTGVVFTVVDADVGDIDYMTGRLVLEDFVVDQVTATQPFEILRILTSPSVDDIYGARSAILIIDEASVRVTAISDG